MSKEAMKLAKAWFERNTYGDEAVDVYEALCAALAEQPAQQEPVASIFISGIGEREFDDWGQDLPVGRNLLYKLPPAQRNPLTDDPLQGAVDWLLEADGEYFCTATVQRTLRIGYNRAKRLCDTAKERAAHGIKENT